jgi:hypothetical protein
MIFEEKKLLVWYDDHPEDRVISIVAGYLANHDRAHNRYMSTVFLTLGVSLVYLEDPRLSES